MPWLGLQGTPHRRRWPRRTSCRKNKRMLEVARARSSSSSAAIDLRHRRSRRGHRAAVPRGPRARAKPQADVPTATRAVIEPVIGRPGRGPRRDRRDRAPLVPDRRGRARRSRPSYRARRARLIVARAAAQDVARAAAAPRPSAAATDWIVVDELRIHAIATHPDHRRAGVGERLLAHALAEARARGCVQATLEVRRGNAPAIALYQGAGFRGVHVARATTRTTRRTR